MFFCFKCAKFAFQETGESEEKFCLIFLDKKGKQLLEQYGGRSLLDATYKTCRYRVNLFNLIVPTPYRYMVSPRILFINLSLSYYSVLDGTLYTVDKDCT